MYPLKFIEEYLQRLPILLGICLGLGFLLGWRLRSENWEKGNYDVEVVVAIIAGMFAGIIFGLCLWLILLEDYY